MRLQCFRPRATCKTGNTRGVRYLENFSKLEYRLFACFVWLYSTVHPKCIVWFLDNFFLLSVHASLKKEKGIGKKKCLRVYTFMPFLYGHAEWVETKDLTLDNFDSHLGVKVMHLSMSCPTYPKSG